MPIQNSDVADIFEKVADFLELEGENQFRVRAYRDAARTVGGHSRGVAEMVEEDEDLTSLPGIGETRRISRRWKGWAKRAPMGSCGR